MALNETFPCMTSKPVGPISSIALRIIHGGPVSISEFATNHEESYRPSQLRTLTEHYVMMSILYLGAARFGLRLENEMNKHI